MFLFALNLDLQMDSWLPMASTQPLAILFILFWPNVVENMAPASQLSLSRRTPIRSRVGRWAMIISTKYCCIIKIILGKTNRQTIKKVSKMSLTISSCILCIEYRRILYYDSLELCNQEDKTSPKYRRMIGEKYSWMRVGIWALA